MDARGRWRSWQFAPAADEARLVAEAAKPGHALFASVQHFAAPRGAVGSMRWREVREQNVGDGALPHVAPLYFDVDCEGDLDRSLSWARWLVEHFVEQLGLSEPAVRVWFSGSKGAHILVASEALGIEPDPGLTADMKTVVAELIAHLASLGAPGLTVDASVYSLPRLLRMAGQRHHRSGLFKVELSHRELFQCSADEIMDLARAPRGGLWTPDELPTGPVPKAAAWWAAALDRARRPRQFRIATARIAGLKVRPDGYVVDELVDASVPECIASILTADVEPGARNRCELQIACWSKAARRPFHEALAQLTAWTDRNRPELSPAHARAKAESILRSVYGSASYGFSCAAARSAARAAGRGPPCASCRAVRPRSYRQVFSLRLRHDPRWSVPYRTPLEVSRGSIARDVDGRVHAGRPDRPGHGPAGNRQDLFRPDCSGRRRTPGRLHRPDARAGHPDPGRPGGPGRPHASLASRAR